ncbi:MAG: DUF5991 domain-containing protein [Pyrinomonadaceae bacterium]
MKSLAKICIASFLTLAFFGISAPAQKTDWVGSYEFYEDGGKTTGGTPIFVAHQMDIIETDDGLVAMIQSNGYQTSRDLVALAKPDGDKLNIYFESYGENNTFEPYQKGDLLFALERKTKKGKTELLTTWGKFMPIVPKNEKSGQVYFVKAEKTGEESVFP